MTKAQKNFIAYYIEADFKDATAAYMKAYPGTAYDSARANASRLLTKANIQDYLSRTLAEIIKQDKLPLEKRIFDFWVKRAFYDITEIIDLHGTVLLSEEQLREKGLAACIDSVNKKIDVQGNETLVYKFADKDNAVKMLQQYIQMIKSDTQQISVTGKDIQKKLDSVFDEQDNDEHK